MTEQARLITVALDRTRSSKRDFAHAIGLTPSELSRLLSGTTRAPVVVCLRIAQVAKLDPLQLLDAAGHADVAALLLDLFGIAHQPPPPTLSISEQELLTRIQRADKRLRHSLLEITKFLIQ